MVDIIDQLKKFGLSEKEAKIYVANLSLGDATANDISLKSNLPRTLTYDILERLIDQGLISYSKLDNKKYFRASDPKELIRIAKEKENAIESVFSQLETLHKTKGTKRPKIEIFEGSEGLKAVMNDILKSHVKEFLSFGSSRSSYEIIPVFMEHWHQERIKKRMIMKIIYNNTDDVKRKIVQFPKSMQYVNYKFMPITNVSPAATLVYANKVVLQSWTKEPFAVVIENEEFANNYKKYFEQLWNVAKKP